MPKASPCPGPHQTGLPATDRHARHRSHGDYRSAGSTPPSHPPRRRARKIRKPAKVLKTVTLLLRNDPRPLPSLQLARADLQDAQQRPGGYTGHSSVLPYVVRHGMGLEPHALNSCTHPSPWTRRLEQVLRTLCRIMPRLAWISRRELPPQTKKCVDNRCLMGSLRSECICLWKRGEMHSPGRKHPPTRHSEDKCLPVEAKTADEADGDDL